MAILKKKYSFNTSNDGWVFTSGGNSTGVLSNGSWVISSIGANNLDTSYIELTTTWEDLEIPAGVTVNQIKVNSIDWRCSTAVSSDGYTIGSFDLLDNLSNIQSNLLVGQSFTGVSSYSTLTGLPDVNIPSVIQDSNSIVKFRFNVSIDNGNDVNAITEILLDDVVFEIDYNTTISVYDDYLFQDGNDYLFQDSNDFIFNESIVEISLLDISNGLNTSTSLNTDLSVDYKININDAYHSLISDNIVLSIKSNLEDLDTNHQLTSDQVSLGINYLLTTDNTNHSLTSDEINLSMMVLLAINNVVNELTSDNIDLTSKYLLTVNNTKHSQISDNLIIQIDYKLIPSDTEHHHIVDNVNFTIIEPEILNYISKITYSLEFIGNLQNEITSISKLTKEITSISKLK